MLIDLLSLGILGLLSVWGLHRLWLLARFRWRPMQNEATGSRAGGDESLPSVTVQLPLYDERTVAARLIRAVGELDYPPERLEIQVLDDSTDQTAAIVDRELARLRERGLRGVVRRRTDRRGFKAGALQAGMLRARGELLCLFDADFVPPRSFLRDLVGEFDDPRVGMVQARWSHLNREASALTRAQAALLDGRFVIEHKVRHERGLYFNFNGTAGLWRRRAIDEAGGWQGDTLTEDLDLSYRAQLAGWRFVYRPYVTSGAELPGDVQAFRSQQNRWARGSVQVLRKLGLKILRAPIPVRLKLEAGLHLTANAGYPLVLLTALLLPLAIGRPSLLPTAAQLALFSLCWVSVLLFYERGQAALGRSALARARDVTLALVLSLGLCASQTGAVLRGLARRSGVFERTPKRGSAAAALRYTRPGGFPLVELSLTAWSAFGTLRAVQLGAWPALPFTLMFVAGFAWVAGLEGRLGASERAALRGATPAAPRPTCDESSIETATRPSPSTATAR